MKLDVILALAGLVVGLIGSGVLAVSLNDLLSALHFSVSLHDVTIQQLTGHGDVPVFTGLDTHLNRGDRRAGTLTALGFWLLVVSFALQAAGLVIGALRQQGT
jgi:hypothetical protein